MALIFYLSSQTTLPGTSLFPHEDKLLHFLAYAIMCILFIGSLRYINSMSLFKVFVFILIYAITDEIHQHFVPGRNASIADLFADSLGVIAIIWLEKSKFFFSKFVIRDKKTY